MSCRVQMTQIGQVTLIRVDHTLDMFSCWMEVCALDHALNFFITVLLLLCCCPALDVCIVCTRGNHDSLGVAVYHSTTWLAQYCHPSSTVKKQHFACLVDDLYLISKMEFRLLDEMVTFHFVGRHWALMIAALQSLNINTTNHPKSTRTMGEYLCRSLFSTLSTFTRNFATFLPNIPLRISEFSAHFISQTTYSAASNPSTFAR